MITNDHKDIQHQMSYTTYTELIRQNPTIFIISENEYQHKHFVVEWDVSKLKPEEKIAIMDRSKRFNQMKLYCLLYEIVRLKSENAKQLATIQTFDSFCNIYLKLPTIASRTGTSSLSRQKIQDFVAEDQKKLGARTEDSALEIFFRTLFFGRSETPSYMSMTFISLSSSTTTFKTLLELLEPPIYTIVGDPDSIRKIATPPTSPAPRGKTPSPTITTRIVPAPGKKTLKIICKHENLRNLPIFQRERTSEENQLRGGFKLVEGWDINEIRQQITFGQITVAKYTDLPITFIFQQYLKMILSKGSALDFDENTLCEILNSLDDNYIATLAVEKYMNVPFDSIDGINSDFKTIMLEMFGYQAYQASVVDDRIIEELSKKGTVYLYYDFFVEDQQKAVPQLQQLERYIRESLFVKNPYGENPSGFMMCTIRDVQTKTQREAELIRVLAARNEELEKVQAAHTEILKEVEKLKQLLDLYIRQNPQKSLLRSGSGSTGEKASVSVQVIDEIDQMRDMDVLDFMINGFSNITTISTSLPNIPSIISTTTTRKNTPPKSPSKQKTPISNKTSPTEPQLAVESNTNELVVLNSTIPQPPPPPPVDSSVNHQINSTVVAVANNNNSNQPPQIITASFSSKQGLGQVLAEQATKLKKTELQKESNKSITKFTPLKPIQELSTNEKIVRQLVPGVEQFQPKDSDRVARAQMINGIDDTAGPMGSKSKKNDLISNVFSAIKSKRVVVDRDEDENESENENDEWIDNDTNQQNKVIANIPEARRAITADEFMRDFLKNGKLMPFETFVQKRKMREVREFEFCGENYHRWVAIVGHIRYLISQRIMKPAGKEFFKTNVGPSNTLYEKLLERSFFSIGEPTDPIEKRKDKRHTSAAATNAGIFLLWDAKTQEDASKFLFSTKNEIFYENHEIIAEIRRNQNLPFSAAFLSLVNTALDCVIDGFLYDFTRVADTKKSGLFKDDVFDGFLPSDENSLINNDIFYQVTVGRQVIGMPFQYNNFVSKLQTSPGIKHWGNYWWFLKLNSQFENSLKRSAFSYVKNPKPNVGRNENNSLYTEFLGTDSMHLADDNYVKDTRKNWFVNTLDGNPIRSPIVLLEPIQTQQQEATALEKTSKSQNAFESVLEQKRRIAIAKMTIEQNYFDKESIKNHLKNEAIDFFESQWKIFQSYTFGNTQQTYKQFVVENTNSAPGGVQPLAETETEQYWRSWLFFQLFGSPQDSYLARKLDQIDRHFEYQRTIVSNQEKFNLEILLNTQNVLYQQLFNVPRTPSGSSNTTPLQTVSEFSGPSYLNKSKLQQDVVVKKKEQLKCCICKKQIVAQQFYCAKCHQGRRSTNTKRFSGGDLYCSEQCFDVHEQSVHRFDDSEKEEYDSNDNSSEDE